MFKKMNDFLSSAGGFNTNSANIKLSKAMLFVLVGDFDYADANNVIKKYITEDNSAQVLCFFSDSEESIYKIDNIEHSLKGRKNFLDAIKTDEEAVKAKIEKAIVDIINDCFNKTEFKIRDELQVNYIFRAEDIYACAVELLSSLIKDICKVKADFKLINEDFYCLVDEKLVANNDYRDAFKYLTFQELENNIISNAKDYQKNCYCMSNKIGGILKEITFEDYLKYISKLCVLKHGERNVKTHNLANYFFNEAGFKNECFNKNERGKFYTLGFFNLEKDNNFIQATIMKWLMDKIAGKQNNNVNIENEVDSLKVLDIETELNKLIGNAVTIVDGEVESDILFGLCKKGNADLGTLPGTNGDVVNQIFGKEIDKFIDDNIVEVFYGRYLNKLVNGFEKNLEEKLKSYIDSANYSISNIIAFLCNSENGVKAVCKKAESENDNKLSSSASSLELWKNGSTDNGNIDVGSIDGESEMIYSVASRYMIRYLEKRRSELVSKILKQYLEVIDKYIAKYEKINAMINKFVGIFNRCMDNCTNALKYNENDVTKKGVKDYYTNVMEEASKNYSDKFRELYASMNSLICDSTLSQDEFETEFSEKMDAFMNDLYGKITIFSKSFSEECEQRLKGENINKMIEAEIKNHSDNLYSMNINIDQNNEYCIIGMIANESDSVVNYLLTDGLQIYNKCAYFDVSKKDFDVIYIKGSFNTENIGRFKNAWKPAYDKLVAKE